MVDREPIEVRQVGWGRPELCGDLGCIVEVTVKHGNAPAWKPRRPPTCCAGGSAALRAERELQSIDLTGTGMASNA